MKILKYPDPFLFKKVKPVIKFDSSLEALGQEMLVAMHENNGVGLAANQVGVDKRIFVMQCALDKPSYIFINPVIVRVSFETNNHEEGCLSLPNIYAPIPRAKTVTLGWKDTQGQAHEQTFENLEAVCIQHEIEHLDGIVFIQKLPPVKRTMVMKKYDTKKKIMVKN